MGKKRVHHALRERHRSGVGGGRLKAAIEASRKKSEGGGAREPPSGRERKREILQLQG